MEANAERPSPWCRSPDECCGLSRILEDDGHAQRYSVLRRISQGGMSDIDAVWDQRLQRCVARKVCRRPIEVDPDQCLHLHTDPVVARFAAEMQILSQLHHSMIVPLYDMGLDSDRRMFFTMPLVKGATFLDVIQSVQSNSGNWSLWQAISALLRISDALRHAHSKSIVHGDLKPTNIILGRKGELYLLDWGLARVVPERGRADTEKSPSSYCLEFLRTRTERWGPPALAGTPSYMPPEFLATGVLSTRFDLYSFGAVLYHLLGGSPPYAETLENTNDPLGAILSGPPDRLDGKVAKEHPKLVRICERCMAQGTEPRYDSMDDVRSELFEHFTRECSGISSLRGALGALCRWTRRLLR